MFAAERDIDGTLGHIDLGDLLARAVVSKNLSIRYEYVASTIGRHALASAFGKWV